MADYISSMKPYQSPIWCYAMIWYAMNRWEEDFFDQTCHFYDDECLGDFIQFMYNEHEISGIWYNTLESKLHEIDSAELIWVFTEDMEREHCDRIEEKVCFKIYQLFAKFMSQDEHRSKIIQHIIEKDKTGVWGDVWDDFCKPRDNGENQKQTIFLINSALEYEEYENISLMDILYNTDWRTR